MALELEGRVAGSERLALPREALSIPRSQFGVRHRCLAMKADGGDGGGSRAPGLRASGGQGSRSYRHSMVASVMRRVEGKELMASRAYDFSSSESPELRVHGPIASLYGCLFHAEGGGNHAESCVNLVAESKSFPSFVLSLVISFSLSLINVVPEGQQTRQQKATLLDR